MSNIHIQLSNVKNVYINDFIICMNKNNMMKLAAWDQVCVKRIADKYVVFANKGYFQR